MSEAAKPKERIQKKSLRAEVPLKSDIELEAEERVRQKRLRKLAGTSAESEEACRRLCASLYPEQLRVVEEVFRQTKPEKRLAVIATRQAGKTYLVTVLLVLSALRRPSSVNLYVAKNRERTRDIIWIDPESGLPQVLKKFGIKAKCDNTHLKVHFPNGSTIELFGTEDRAQTEKIHGRRPHLVAVDECQDFPIEALRSLIEDILPAGLATHRGALVLTGTPGAVPAGRFYEITERIPNEEGLVPDWAVHRLTILDNVRYPAALEMVDKKESPDVRSALTSIVQDEMRRQGWRETSPDFLRNFKGQWVRDDSRTCYRYDSRINSWSGLEDDLPRLPEGHGWSYVLGGDCATEKDSTAAVVLAFSEAADCVYQVDEEQGKTPKNSDVEAFFREMLRRRPLVGSALDPSGMGNPTVRELRDNEGLDIEVWTKSFGPLAKYNDQVRVSGFMADGRFRAIRGSELEQQLLTLERDPRTRREKGSSPNDLADSFLYGFQRVLELWTPPKSSAPVSVRSELEGQAESWRRSVERIRRRNERQDSGETSWWSRWSPLSPQDDPEEVDEDLSLPWGW